MACKLTYFDFKALGEPIRMILTYIGIDFQDLRIDRFGKDWNVIKATLPLLQLPILEIDGIKLYQSKVICRYLAKKTDLYGIDAKEEAEIDTAVDIIYDLIMKMRVLRDVTDRTEQERKYEEFKGTAIPQFLKHLDELAAKNQGYLACQKLSWADFYFAGAIEYLDMLCRMKICEAYPNLKKVFDNVMAIPNLKDYLMKRTNTDF